MFLPDEKSATGPRRVEPLPAGDPLLVAMAQHNGAASSICVGQGQAVRAGEVIGRADSDGAVRVHSPISGRVGRIVKVETVHACDVPAVEIVPDGKDHRVSGGAEYRVPDDPPSLAARIREAGVGPANGRGASPADLIVRAGAVGVRHLIINALESEPYVTRDYRILAEHGQLIVGTAELIARCLDVRRIRLVLDRAGRNLISQLGTVVQGTAVNLALLSNKYPQAATPLLIRTLLREEIPYGGTSLDVGAIVLDIDTTLAIGRSVFDGGPSVSQIMTVAGDAVSRQGNYDVPIGTPLHRIIEHVGLRDTIARVVIGGPMTGVAVTSLDMVTTKGVGSLLLLSNEQVVVPRPGPCVRCGWCIEHCPVGLDPPALLAAVEGDSDAETKSREIAGLYPHACLGCGICSYVCPAGLSLTEGVARACARTPLVK